MTIPLTVGRRSNFMKWLHTPMVPTNPNNESTEFGEYSRLVGQWISEEQRKVDNDASLSDDEKSRKTAALGNRRRGLTRSLGELLNRGMDDMGKGKIRLPSDYQYDNAQPGQELKANTIFGLAVELDENLQEKGSVHLMPVGLRLRITLGLQLS